MVEVSNKTIWKYVGSYQNKLETLVFHVFEQEVVE